MKKPLSTVGVYASYLPKCFTKSGKFRIKLKKYIHRQKARKMKLAMTLLVKDEEKLIEKNIRFHYAMGVNFFVITIHNSTDNTLTIIKKLQEEGIPIEIITANDDLGYMQDVRVDKMIKIAKNKFKADWVINADADEFYFSKNFNLRYDITKYNVGNAIEIESVFSFPDENTDRLSCPYFIMHYIPKFWYQLDSTLPTEGRFIAPCSCIKVIHSTKGYIKIAAGNHYVNLKNKKTVTTNNIVLYHFTDGSYADFEEKVKRYYNTFSTKEQQAGMGEHVQRLIDLYDRGKLKEHYNSLYSKEMRDKLIEIGIVGKDYSLINYLKYKQIQ